MHVKILSAKWQPFYPGGDELIQRCCSTSLGNANIGRYEMGIGSPILYLWDYISKLIHHPFIRGKTQINQSYRSFCLKTSNVLWHLLFDFFKSVYFYNITIDVVTNDMLFLYTTVKFHENRTDLSQEKRVDIINNILYFVLGMSVLETYCINVDQTCHSSHLKGTHITMVSRLWTAGNAWVCSQHCGYWCPGAKAPGHQ